MTVWPASAVEVPLKVRSCAASAAFSMLSPLMVLMVTVGAVVSTLNACAEDAALPFTLVTLTCTLASPSFRPLRSAAGTVQVQSPLASTVVVYVFPAKIMVTVWPASTLDDVPDSTRSWPFSAALRTLSSVTLLMVMATGARSTSTTVPIATGLPEASCALALISSEPSAHWDTSAAGTAACQEPSASTVAEYAFPLMVTVTALPAARSVLVPDTIRF
ncbi:Uncharacterised protein [Enterobacter roggenkampii]|uniref:Secreted protein n=1 Tax=Enterobacter roggenkampii TaxID=1812935 RepID=A0ABD7KPV8_9ENTR|nr:Uncharacterised protein [Enterobacter roggenkampii]SAD35695.1 Uncharacterised protein [Enterobacter roggenkampii]